MGNQKIVVSMVLDYLHSQGVVIKVDRELPSRFLYTGRTLQESYKLGKKDMIEAGYSAWKPLIDDKVERIREANFR